MLFGLKLLMLILLSILLAVVSVIFIRGFFMYLKAVRKKPVLQTIETIRNKSTFTKIDDISIEFKYILLIAEDKFFFSHSGYRTRGIYKAMLLNLREKRVVTGASTISQQLAKNMFFSFERTYSRKVAEIFAVRKLEKILSKEEILELYCNCIEFGYGAYSIAEAAKIYFGVLPKDLTVGQAIRIVAVLPAPSKCDLFEENHHFQKSLERKVNSFADYVFPEDRENFILNAGIKDELREKYSEVFKKEYEQKKYNNGVFEKKHIHKHVKNHKNFECNSESLVKHAYDCFQQPTIYLWGGLGEYITKSIIDSLKLQYPNVYTDEKCIELEKIVGKNVRGFDCSGLIKNYLMGGLDNFRYEAELDWNSKMLLAMSTKRGDIKTLPEKAGICLYMEGHVGIYVGNGLVIEATSNTKFGNGVVKTKLKDREWIQWFHCPKIRY